MVYIDIDSCIYTLPGNPEHERLRNMILRIGKYTETNYLKWLEDIKFYEYDGKLLSKRIKILEDFRQLLYSCSHLMELRKEYGYIDRNTDHLTKEQLDMVFRSMISFSISIADLNHDLEEFGKLT